MKKCFHTLWSFDSVKCSNCRKNKDKLFSKIDLKKIPKDIPDEDKLKLEKKIKKMIKPYTKNHRKTHHLI